MASLNDKTDEDGWIVYRASFMRIAFFTMIGLAMIPGGFYCLDAPYLKAKFAGYILLILSPFMILKCLQVLMGGLVMFKYNSNFISARGMLGTRTLRWSEIASVGIIQQTQYALGFIKTHSSEQLYVKPISGWKLYIPTAWAGLSKDQMRQLGGLFNAICSRTQQSNSPSATDETKNEYADAVVARYMARKADEEKNHKPSQPFGQSTSPQPTSQVTFGKRHSLP
jgi:hypothetical protein